MDPKEHIAALTGWLNSHGRAEGLAAVKVLVALVSWRLVRYASSPGQTSQTIMTFWSSAIPSEWPFHILLIHSLLTASGFYGHLGGGPLRNIGFAVAVAGLPPMLKMVLQQLGARAVYVEALRQANIPVVLADRSLSASKLLVCALPFPQFLMRNIECVAGVEYGEAPAEVTVTQALREAATAVGHSIEHAVETVAEAVSGHAHHQHGSASANGNAAASAAAGRTMKLKLDIYWHKSRRVDGSNPRPVLLYVHGGGWVTGHKNYHSLGMLYEVARRGWLIVTINYRLAGDGHRPPYPYALYDCKRAVAWIRSHAAEYGGDPSFIVAAGESAGGHLALMLGLTPNIPSLQPEGEIDGADTRVDGVVDLYGVTDWTDHQSQWSNKGAPVRRFLEKMVVKRKYADHTHEFVRGSPLWWVHGSTLPRALAAAGIDVKRPEEVTWAVHQRRSSGQEQRPSPLVASLRALDAWGSKSSGMTAAAAATQLQASSGATASSSVRNRNRNGATDEKPGGSAVTQQHPADSSAPAQQSYTNPAQAHADVLHASNASSSIDAAAERMSANPFLTDMLVDRPVPPVFMVHGDVDTIVPVEDSRMFYKALANRRDRTTAQNQQQTVQPAVRDVYVELPGAHHAYNFLLSPRTLALADAVSDWLSHLYHQTMAARRANDAAGRAGTKGGRDAKL